MKPSGVWSFRTRTGVARVVNGRLRVRHTPWGLLSRVRGAGWQSWFRPLAFGGGLVGVIGPLRQLVQAAVADQSLVAAVSAAGIGSLFVVFSMLGVIGTSLWSTLRQSATIAVYDINRVSVDETELTVCYEADDGEHETTVVAHDEEALEEAVTVLQLKGAPVETD